MKKLKLYLDTSVISALDDPKKPDRMQETWVFWNDLEERKFDVVVSSVLIREIDRCRQPKRDKLYEFLSSIEYEKVEEDNEIKSLSDYIISLGILTKKSRNDSLHIACAIVSSCNYIISWNFKHLVNIKTVSGVRAITNLKGYNTIDIIAPPSINI